MLSKPIIAFAFGGLMALNAAPTTAQDTLRSMTLANDLGAVLAAESFCGLTYDQGAIGAWIDANVPANDMGFAGNLDLMTMGAASNQNDMGASQKTAHCRQISRVAQSYGFTR